MGVLPIRFAGSGRACATRHPWRDAPVDDILVVARAGGATFPPATRQADGAPKGAGILPASSVGISPCVVIVGALACDCPGFADFSDCDVDAQLAARLIA